MFFIIYFVGQLKVATLYRKAKNYTKLVLIQIKKSSSGGIGRRARLKIVFREKCGFDSHLEHY